MGLVRRTAVVATDGPVDKYGGVALAPEVLHSMAAALSSGAVPMIWNHDPRHPVAASDVEARVETLSSGELAVVIDFSVDEAEWARIQQQFDEAGVPGGFSFTGSEPLAEFGAASDHLVFIAAEAGHFDDADLTDVGADIGAIVHTKVARLYQFSALEEVARVIIELGPGVVIGTGTSVLGSAIYAAIGRLLGRKRRPGPTMVDLRTQTADGRPVQAIVTTDDPRVAQEAVRELLDRAFEDGGLFVYDEPDRRWDQQVAPPALPAPVVDTDPLDDAT